MAKTSTKAISENVNSRQGAGCLIAFFSVFLLAGLAAFVGLILKPVKQSLEARSWPQLTCVIASSQVRTHSDSDGSTYSADITYTYRVNGLTYTGDRYSFMKSSGPYNGALRAVQRYPVGSQTTCYVNPNDPNDSVLHAQLGLEILFGLIPLIFVVVGAGGIYGTLRGLASKSRGGSKWRPAATPAAALSGVSVAPWSGEAGGRAMPGSGPVVLRPRSSRVGAVIGLLLFGLIWNGVISVLVLRVLSGWSRGDGDWLLTLFAIPFVLAGVAVTIAFVSQLLLLAAPRATLTVSTATVPLGGSLNLNWSLSGGFVMPERLRLTLEGREEATYRRGTSTYTDKSVFASVALLDTTERQRMMSGQSTVQVPAELMHSFEAPNNKIVWCLKAEGNIRSWPDFKDEYPFVVTPTLAYGPHGGDLRHGEALSSFGTGSAL